VEGRGERLSPLPWLRDVDATHDRPGLLIVTPSCGVSTPAAFRAWDEGARSAGGAARMASAHLAEELRAGRLRVSDLLARASVLAAANDLAPAAAVLEPGLVPFKRALLRLLGRPVGVSGSGPTHWALYPSHAEAAAAAEAVCTALAAGELTAPGPRDPFVAAARILSTTRPTTGPAEREREP
jgi:4-diphosphocytidyl-2C-methyl-D-erythritol kinase